MESLPTVKLGALLKKHYTRRLLRNIWRAMRAERLNFLQGRIPFESYVYDGVINAATSERVHIDDGSKFEAPDSPIDGKTLENFIAKSSSIFEIDRTSGYQNIKTANATLRYMHAFLWSRHPERVKKWETQKGQVFDELIVRNLDDTFRLFETRKTFPHGIKIVGTLEADPSLLSLSVQKAFQNRESEDFEAFDECQAPLLAVMAFAPVKNDIINRAILLNPHQWELVQRFHSPDEETGERDQFDRNLLVYRGISISFQSRDYALEGVPAIPTDQSVSVVRFTRKHHTRTEYADIRIRELEPLHPFDNEDGGSILVACTQTTFRLDNEEYRCLPIHLSTEEERLITEMFEFIS